MHETGIKSWRVTTALASVFATLASVPAMAQELEIHLADGTFETSASAVSADGSVVVGQSVASTLEGGRAFRWTTNGGFEQLTDSRSFANGISADGTTIIGSIGEHGSTRAFRWTEAGGLVELGMLDGEASADAYDVSADGAVIVGRSVDPGNIFTAVRWTGDGGVESLGTLEGGNASVAYGVSGNGLVIVGASRSGTSGPWMEAFRWTEAGGMVELGKLNNSDESQARAASHDGSVIVGWARDGQSQLQTAIRWTEAAGVESLGMLNDGNLSLAYDVSDDGLVIVGSAADGADNNTRRGFRWTEDSGMQTVEDWLRDAGADIASNVTRNAYGVNEDGTVVVGDTHDNKMFIARTSQSGGGNPPPGLITIDDMAASLSSAGTANSIATNGLGTLMNGAGSRPLDRRTPQGRSVMWIGGDWGRDDHGIRDGEVRLGEIGLGHNFGGLQLNGAFGLTGLDQNTLLGGRNDIDANYVKLEMLTPVAATGAGGLWFAATGTALWGSADIRRNYIGNGGSVESSFGQTDVEGYGIRGRLQWEDLAPGVSPYGELSYARACLDAYTESGGAFPAAFNELCGTATEARYGIDFRAPVSGQFHLISTLEGVHRFQDSGPNVTGQVIGLAAFNLGAANYRQDWLRAGAGFEFDIAGSTLSVMGNATTNGESANAWVAANWRVTF